jgi:Rhs element Vgr protein
MSGERVIPQAEARSVATVSILSEGSQIPDSISVLSIVVDREVDRIPAATIVVQDGEASRQTFAVSNGEQFAPGKTIEIHAGYRNDEETLFKGVVVRHSVKVRKNVSLLVVECRHACVKMTTRPANAYFHEMSDQDVADQLLAKHGLTVETGGSAVTHAELVQYDATDWDFLLCRAEANGCWVIAEDDKVTFAPPDLGQEPVLSLEYGATIHDLDLEIDARLQYKAYKALAWDPASQSLLGQIEGADPSAPPAGNLAADALADVTANESLEYRHVAVPESELQPWADAAIRRSRLGKIRGKLRTDGTGLVRPGQLISIAGSGERFDGTVVVTGVRHQIEKGNWETVLQLGQSPARFAETFTVHQPAAAALIPSVHGMQIGVVTNLEDPIGENRVQVRMPMINPDDDGAWMRVATLDAGDGRGTFFRPEIGDEVVVGFLNNDPRHGIILGMLHSSGKPAPIEAANDNHEKGYVSRSGITIHIDDDKKVLTLSTPGGHEAILDDTAQKLTLKDSNGNSIVMDAQGITIESVMDLKLSAAKDMAIEGGANMELSGGSSAKLSGGASAELSAGGNTTVKGAVVQIN